jgi:hypothetical protein
LRRAREHFNALDEKIRAFFEQNPYPVIVERAAKDLYVVRANNLPKIPSDEWALIIGDCVHNLRSSLDYIAWELAGANPHDTQAMFPIFEAKSKWSTRRLKRMSPEAQGFIESRQPYHAEDPPGTPLNAIRVLPSLIVGDISINILATMCYSQI